MYFSRREHIQEEKYNKVTINFKNTALRPSPLDTAANIGLLYPLQMMVIVKQLVERRLVGINEVLG
jgi:hypothetical protein